MEIASIKMINDWRKDVRATLQNALALSVDVFGRTAEQACKHVVILMAQSLASASSGITPIAAERREIKTDSKGEYVERWKQGWSNPQKIYKWFFSKVHDKQGNLIAQPKNFRGADMDYEKWENVQIIKRRGLARSSWMWGLSEWAGRSVKTDTGQYKSVDAIPGTYEMILNKNKFKIEAIKRNKLGYITRIMPGGWEEAVAQRAANKIFGQAREKMMNEYAAALRGSNAGLARSVSSYFLPEAA